MTQRNTLVDGEWILREIDDLSLCSSFDCGNGDIDEYFHEDVRWHKEELLCRTYCLNKCDNLDVIIALLDFCNDKVELDYIKHRFQINPTIHRFQMNPKIHYHFLPAVKLTRLGVVKPLHGNNIGTQAINMVKQFFTLDNRTGCRFLTVDANNEVVRFYEKNGFDYITDKDKGKNQRVMFFDLKTYKHDKF